MADLRWLWQFSYNGVLDKRIAYSSHAYQNGLRCEAMKIEGKRVKSIGKFKIDDACSIFFLPIQKRRENPNGLSKSAVSVHPPAVHIIISSNRWIIVHSKWKAQQMRNKQVMREWGQNQETRDGQCVYKT